MGLVDISNCLGTGETPPIQAESLLSAALASLLTGIKHEHIELDLAKSFCREVNDRWRDLTNVLPVEEIYISEFQAEFIRVLDDLHPALGFTDKRNTSDADDLNGDYISIQSVNSLRHWLKNNLQDKSVDIRLKGQDLSYRDIRVLVGEISDPAKVKKDATIGLDSTWVTPAQGDMRFLIEEAKSKGDYRQRSAVAQVIRNRLGLWRTRKVHCLVFGWNEANLNTAPSKQRQLKAPCLFDARSYERFRHWPSLNVGSANEEFAGRTYELDPNIRIHDGVDHGVSEYVTHPIPISEVTEVDVIGWCGMPPDEGDVRICHCTFANEVSGKAKLKNLIESVNQELGEND